LPRYTSCKSPGTGKIPENIAYFLYIYLYYLDNSRKNAYLYINNVCLQSNLLFGQTLNRRPDISGSRLLQGGNHYGQRKRDMKRGILALTVCGVLTTALLAGACSPKNTPAGEIDWSQQPPPKVVA
jgi:hypothetical protein